MHNYPKPRHNQLPFNGESYCAVAGSIEADLSEWDGVGQNVDVELLTVLQTQCRQCKADDGQDEIELQKDRSFYMRSSFSFLL